jgi:CubicO group peptidase (beta-lactamase class C family)
MGGETIVSSGLGWARRDVRMTEDTLLPWFCCAKLIGAIGFALLWERGQLTLDTTLASVMPDFASGNKDAITFRHLLTHTAGIKPDPLFHHLWDGENALWSVITAMELPDPSLVGTASRYSALWAWFTLAKAIERVDGSPYSDFARREVLDPLGMRDTHIGLPVGEFPEHLDRIGLVYDTVDGPADAMEFMSSKERIASYHPGVNALGPMRDLARLLEFLAGLGQYPEILQESTRAAMTARHRVGLYDPPHRGYASWGLGVNTESRYFGRECSMRTFGHKGFSTSMAFADPEVGLAIAFLANGIPTEDQAQERDQHLVSSLYADLGLGEGDFVAPMITQVEPRHLASEASGIAPKGFPKGQL